MSRTVSLTAVQSDLIDRLVDDGRYRTRDEALDAGLKMLEQDEAKASTLRVRLTEGLDQARSGHFADGSGTEAITRAFEAAARRP